MEHPRSRARVTSRAAFCRLRVLPRSRTPSAPAAVDAEARRATVPAEIVLPANKFVISALRAASGAVGLDGLAATALARWRNTCLTPNLGKPCLGDLDLLRSSAPSRSAAALAFANCRTPPPSRPFGAITAVGASSERDGADRTPEWGNPRPERQGERQDKHGAESAQGLASPIKLATETVAENPTAAHERAGRRVARPTPLTCCRRARLRVDFC
jgi:hypothetical protein